MKAVFRALALFPLVAQLAIAQHAPTDTKILHEVDAAVGNERAFRGLLIAAKVSREIVTLTGTLLSEGDNVLVLIEVVQIAGAVTVLKNLEVHAAGMPAASTSEPTLTNPNGAQVRSLTKQPPAPKTITVKTIIAPTSSFVSAPHRRHHHKDTQHG
jgi:hypothetical protein